MEIPVELPRTKEDKQRAAKTALSSIEKTHGKGSIFSLGRDSAVSMPHIATGLYQFDNYVAGIGGIPKARITELFGPESSGKTTLALTVVAAAQRTGGLAAYIDAENAVDPVWCERNGVDVKALMVSQPDNGEQALDILNTLVESGAFSVIVVDSVAALVPKAELEGDFGDSNMGLHARLMSQGMRMLSGRVRRSECAVIFINQLRQKIGVVYGNPEVTTGGKALAFYASLRLDVRKKESLKDGERIYGNKVKIKCVKNKVSIPYRTMEADLLFDESRNRYGFDLLGNLLDSASSSGIIVKAGAWYSFREERMGQGRDSAVEALMNNGEWELAIRKALQEQRDKELAAVAAE